MSGRVGRRPIPFGRGELLPSGMISRAEHATDGIRQSSGVRKWLTVVTWLWLATITTLWVIPFILLPHRRKDCVRLPGIINTTKSSVCISLDLLILSVEVISLFSEQPVAADSRDFVPLHNISISSQKNLR